MKSGARWRLLCLTLIGLGLVVSVYLLARTFTLMVGGGPEAIDVCSAVFGASCDAALLSPTSRQLGIPLAGWGFVYYGTLACLLVLAWALGEAFELPATLGALLLAAAGAGGERRSGRQRRHGMGAALSALFCDPRHQPGAAASSLAS